MENWRAVLSGVKSSCKKSRLPESYFQIRESLVSSRYVPHRWLVVPWQDLPFKEKSEKSSTNRGAQKPKIRCTRTDGIILTDRFKISTANLGGESPRIIKLDGRFTYLRHVHNKYQGHPIYGRSSDDDPTTIE